MQMSAHGKLFSNEPYCIYEPASKGHKWRIPFLSHRKLRSCLQNKLEWALTENSTLDLSSAITSCNFCGYLRCKAKIVLLDPLRLPNWLLYSKKSALLLLSSQRILLQINTAFCVVCNNWSWKWLVFKLEVRAEHNSVQQKCIPCKSLENLGRTQRQLIAAVNINATASLFMLHKVIT